MSPLVWVLGASVLVWGGLWAYLLYTDSRLRRVERDMVRGEQR